MLDELKRHMIGAAAGVERMTDLGLDTNETPRDAQETLRNLDINSAAHKAARKMTEDALRFGDNVSQLTAADFETQATRIMDEEIGEWDKAGIDDSVEARANVRTVEIQQLAKRLQELAPLYREKLQGERHARQQAVRELDDAAGRKAA